MFKVENLTYDYPGKRALQHIFFQLPSNTITALVGGEGMMILVSSHILSELQDYCSHMIILREGLIVTQCAIDETSKRMMEVYLESA